MPAHTLAAKRSAGVTPEVILREHVTPMSPPSTNKASHSGFEAMSPEGQNKGIRGPTK